jgi:hypothetical protein
MAYQDCENCGARVYGGFCVNCHEEIFIAEQYERDGEAIPDALLDQIAQFEPQERIGKP